MVKNFNIKCEENNVTLFSRLTCHRSHCRRRQGQSILLSSGAVSRNGDRQRSFITSPRPCMSVYKFACRSSTHSLLSVYFYLYFLSHASFTRLPQNPKFHQNKKVKSSNFFITFFFLVCRYGSSYLL